MGSGGIPTEMECMPSGCQCQCHHPPPGIEIKHLVPCCTPKYEALEDNPAWGDPLGLIWKDDL